MSRGGVNAIRVLAVAVVAAGGLVACSNGDDSEAQADESPTTSPDSSDGGRSEDAPENEGEGGETSGDPATNGAAQAGIDLADPPDPIGEVIVPIGHDGIDETKVEVLEAKKRGKVLLVTLRFTPEGTTSDGISIFSAMGEQSFAPALIDLDNLKKYEYVPTLTSGAVVAKVKVGEPLYGFTAFPLPPDDLTSIDMKVSELAPTIEDLPLP